MAGWETDLRRSTLHDPPSPTFTGVGSARVWYSIGPSRCLGAFSAPRFSTMREWWVLFPLVIGRAWVWLASRRLRLPTHMFVPTLCTQWGLFPRGDRAPVTPSRMIVTRALLRVLAGAPTPTPQNGNPPGGYIIWKRVYPKILPSRLPPPIILSYFTSRTILEFESQLIANLPPSSRYIFNFLPPPGWGIPEGPCPSHCPPRWRPHRPGRCLRGQPPRPVRSSSSALRASGLSSCLRCLFRRKFT